MLNSICSSFDVPRNFAKQCFSSNSITNKYGMINIDKCLKHNNGITTEEKEKIQSEYDFFVENHVDIDEGIFDCIRWWFENRKRINIVSKECGKCEINMRDVYDVLAPDEYIIAMLNTNKTGNGVGEFYDINLYTSYGNVIICDFYDEPNIHNYLYGGVPFDNELCWKKYWTIIKKCKKTVKLSDGLIDLIKYYAEKYGCKPIDNTYHNKFHNILFDE